MCLWARRWENDINSNMICVIPRLWRCKCFRTNRCNTELLLVRYDNYDLILLHINQSKSDEAKIIQISDTFVKASMYTYIIAYEIYFAETHIRNTCT